MKQFNYTKARQELDELLAWFESEEVNIETALKKYEEAEALIKQIEAYLSDKKAQVEIVIKKQT
jgi:exodeoxyribonuclease VII small subunit